MARRKKLGNQLTTYAHEHSDFAAHFSIAQVLQPRMFPGINIMSETAKRVMRIARDITITAICRKWVSLPCLTVTANIENSNRHCKH